MFVVHEIAPVSYNPDIDQFLTQNEEVLALLKGAESLHERIEAEVGHLLSLEETRRLREAVMDCWEYREDLIELTVRAYLQVCEEPHLGAMEL